jgi:hypothetical protein
MFRRSLVVALVLAHSVASARHVARRAKSDEENELRQQLMAVLREHHYGSSSVVSVESGVGATGDRNLAAGDICNNFVDSLLGGNTSSPLDCYCTADILPPAVSLGCDASSPICFLPPDVLCGSPGFGVSLDVLNIIQGGLPVTLDVCLNNPTVLGIVLPAFIPACINFGQNILDALTGILGGFADVGADSVNGTVPALPAMCDFTFAGESCATCTPCLTAENKVGASFDCSNLFANLTTTDCIYFGL